MELALGRKRADKPGKLPEKLDRIEYPEIGPDKKLHFCLNPTCILTASVPFYAPTPTIGRFLRTKSVTTANGPLSSEG